MDPMIMTGIIGVAVAVAAGALVMLFSRDDSTKAGDRLSNVVGKGNRKDSSADLLLAEAMKARDQQTFLDAITPEFFNLTKIFEQADANIRPSALFGIALALGVVGSMLSAVLVGSIYVAPVGGFTFFSVPWIWLYFKRSMRLGKFAAQLCDALELIARALRAGHSLAAGIHVVAEEMPPPVSAEFGRVYEEQNLGIPLEDALRSMCERVPNIDLRFFVTAVIIQRQTGGDLAEILDKIGYVIRERFKILGQVQALTGEGRISGIVLIALPFALFGTMLHLAPDYVSLLWTTDMGVKMSVVALVMQVIGAWAINYIIDIKV